MLTATYKKITRKKKPEFEEWLTMFGFNNYLDGINDCRTAMFRHLIDSFGFTNEQIEQLKGLSRNDIGMINERYITAQEMINGLIAEGYESLKDFKEEEK